jgi:hypothetical protein
MGMKFVRYNSDFFQRVGLLKMLVAVMDPQRRSTAQESITRKLSQLLYGPTSGNQTSVEYFIRNAAGSSWNFSITEPNIKYALEWGRLTGFVGSGNQITERGLLLRHIMGDDAIASINKGNMNINPFDLSLGERLYLLYVHLELDTALQFLLRRLATLPSDEAIRGVDADKITCFAFYDLFLLMGQSRNSSNLLLTLKSLRELIGKMVTELDLAAEIPIAPVVKPKQTAQFRQKPDQRDRKRTKTSDHEAIPRFELLVDLGLLTKKVDAEGPDEEKARKSWRYWPTQNLYDFCSGLPESFDREFCWNRFAQCSAAFVSNMATRLDVIHDAPTIARWAYSAYSLVKRRFGHTPIESVAIITMINALVDSKIVEVKDIHELFMTFKRDNLFSDTVRYAAGNDLDKMFIDIQPEFINEMEKYYGI